LPVDSQAIFLWSDGKLIAIARQGDSVPGGHIVSASFRAGNYDLNDNGDVAFNALLDTGDEAVYVWSHGAITLVAKTGTVVPGVGTITSLDQYGEGLPNGFVALNDRGQVAFAVTLESGGGALLLATPGGKGSSDVAAVSSALAAPTPVANGVDNDLTGVVVLLQADTASLTTALSAGRKHRTGTPRDGFVIGFPSGLSADALV